MMIKTPYSLYGFVGIPLAFGALPLYLHLPKVWAENSSLSLTSIGILLWIVRLFDGITDPLFGSLANQGSHRRLFALSLGIFSLAFWMLCRPLNTDSAAWLTFAWLFLTLLVTSVSFSAGNTVFLAWGASLGEDSQSRGRLVIYREVFTLTAVIVAAILPTLWRGDLATGVKHLSNVCLLLCGLAIIAARRLPVKKASNQGFTWRWGNYISLLHTQFLMLWNHQTSRYLLSIFLLNGVASAIPATLFLFFVEDVLGQSQRAGIFLGLYFVAGLVALPFWAKITPRFGRVRLWQVSMLLAMSAFALAGWLGPGDSAAFAVVCVLSGLAFGADLSLPASMACDCGEHNQQSGILFGWWNLISKLNLAIAAGLTFPLLSFLGYQTGAGTENTLALKYCYVALPIAIKCVALYLLTRYRVDLNNLTEAT